MKWKEQLYKEYGGEFVEVSPNDSGFGEIIGFISTEIIEKLIDSIDLEELEDLSKLKQQLREKWL